MQQNKSFNMVKSCNISRHSSASSKGSNSDKNNVVKKDSYIALQPKFDPEKGLAFVNAVKEVRIKTQPDEEEVVQQQTQQQQKLMRKSSFNKKEQKDDLMKKSHFSRVRRADSQTIDHQ